MRKRRGAATLEFVFAFIFLLIFFIVIISFQFITIQRMTGAISVWRIQRVGSFVEDDNLFKALSPNNKPCSSNSSNNYNNAHNNSQNNEKSSDNNKEIGFGDLVVMSLKSANITIPKTNNSDKQYKIVYYSPFLKTFEKYFYNRNIENPYDKIYWVEPKSPPDCKEHGNIGGGS